MPAVSGRSGARPAAAVAVLVLCLSGTPVLLSACSPGRQPPFPGRPTAGEVPRATGGADRTAPDLLAATMLPRLVLQPRDLGTGLTRFDEGPQTLSDAPPGERGEPGRFERQGGWKARYRHAGSGPPRGPLVVESRADVFRDTGGAARELAALARALPGGSGRGTGMRVIPARELDVGEDSIGLTTATGGATRPVLTVTLAWRYRNATASLVVTGFTNSMTLLDAVALARRQQAHLSSR